MSVRAGVVVSCAIAAPLAAAQPTAVISSDLAATALGDAFGGQLLTDTFSATTGNLFRAGFSYSREVSELNPANGETTSSSAEVMISRAHNFRPTSSGSSELLFDVDITGRIERSAPSFDVSGDPAAFGALMISLPVGLDPLTVPVSMVGTASYSSDQAGAGTAFGQPGIAALRVIESNQPQIPVAQLTTDDPSFGTIDIAAVGAGFTIEAFSDLSEQLFNDFGTSTVEFDLTVTYVGIPAPSAALAFGAAGLFAARRRRQ
ncbi:MAG: hypothetical protein AAFS11_05475 [Planctomycetota bacterium]